MNSPKRLVVKIGSSTLIDKDNRLDREYLRSVAAQVARLREEGWNPIIVSSAAIACGLETLGIQKRPTDLPSLQAAASVGQSVLSAAYDEAFARYGIVTSLVLLTRRDTADREAYLHARDTFNQLLEFGVVPIVNENDTVSVEQIRFGDNDTLAALVACLTEAQLTVILSDVDCLYTANPQTNEDARPVSCVERIGAAIINGAGGVGSETGSGGMITKIKAARVLMAAGIPLVVCHGRADEAIRNAVARVESTCEKDQSAFGTLFVAAEKPHEITPRKLWIALGDAARGTLVVDRGAQRALIASGSSLLAVGVNCVEGSFENSDIVDVKSIDGRVFARGRVSFSSDEVALACGKTREELSSNRLLAELAEKPIIHRDELIVFD